MTQETKTIELTPDGLWLTNQDNDTRFMARTHTHSGDSRTFIRIVQGWEDPEEKQEVLLPIEDLKAVLRHYCGDAI